MFEVVNYYLPKIEKSNALINNNVSKDGYFLISAHREENINSDQNFDNLVLILNSLAENYKLPIIVSTHPRTLNRINATGAKFNELVKVMKPMGYSDYVNLQMNAKANALRKLRLRGFNAPLSIVQTLMGRKQVFPEFLNEEIITSDALLFRGQNIFFDLDETLVMFGKPIELAVKFLEECYLKGYSCYLITRHTFDISTTLKKIGVNEKYFKYIYKVNPKENKGEILLSFGCNKDDLFIDNEFPERLEVRNRTGCNVIDVNQIEFVTFVQKTSLKKT